MRSKASTASRSTVSSPARRPPGARDACPRPVVLRGRRVCPCDKIARVRGTDDDRDLGSERDRVRVEEIPDAVGVAECSSGVVEATIVQRHPSLDERSGTMDMLREATGVRDPLRVVLLVATQSVHERGRPGGGTHPTGDGPTGALHAARIASASASAASNSPMNASGMTMRLVVRNAIVRPTSLRATSSATERARRSSPVPTAVSIAMWYVSVISPPVRGSRWSMRSMSSRRSRVCSAASANCAAHQRSRGETVEGVAQQHGIAEPRVAATARAASAPSAIGRGVGVSHASAVSREACATASSLRRELLCPPKHVLRLLEADRLRVLARKPLRVARRVCERDGGGAIVAAGLVPVHGGEQQWIGLAAAHPRVRDIRGGTQPIAADTSSRTSAAASS